MGESTKRTRGGIKHKEDQGSEKAQREPGGEGGAPRYLVDRRIPQEKPTDRKTYG